MRQSDLNIIRALPLFRAITTTSFKEIAKNATLQRFPQRTVLTKEGDFPDFLYIPIEGSVDVFCTHNGHETTVDIVQPVAACFLDAVIRNNVCLASGRTLGPAHIVLIPARTVRDLFARDIAFVGAVMRELAASYSNATRLLKNEKLRTGTERLANWILKAGLRPNRRRAVKLPFEKHTLASILGMTPETLSRSFARLAKYGVKTSGRHIFIEDRRALSSFAKPAAAMDAPDPSICTRDRRMQKARGSRKRLNPGLRAS
ncbi:MAG: helix-turn-helix domain-containing protein [Hyphomicrobiaceae bacterium]